MNSLATFQTIMDDIFQEEIVQGWLHIYMDDMIITTEDDEILHKLCINHILDKLEKYDLFLKPEKCKFHQCKVKYLSVIIGNGTVKMDPVKIQGIMEWPTLKTVKDVQSFLGFCCRERSSCHRICHLLRDSRVLDMNPFPRLHGLYPRQSPPMLK